MNNVVIAGVGKYIPSKGFAYLSKLADFSIDNAWLRKFSDDNITAVGLKEEIINGTYPIGGLFPAEPELQTVFGVSRITVRHAVQLLVDEGYLQRIHGVGTVVVSQKESLQLQNLLSFSEEYKGAGVHSDIISFEERISASSLVCSKLNLSKGSEVSCHERLRWSDNSPIAVSYTHLDVYKRQALIL